MFSGKWITFPVQGVKLPPQKDRQCSAPIVPKTFKTLHVQLVIWLKFPFSYKGKPILERLRILVPSNLTSTWSNSDRSRGINVLSSSKNQLFVNKATRMPSALRHLIKSTISVRGLAFSMLISSKNRARSFETIDGSLRFSWNSFTVTSPFSNPPQGPKTEQNISHSVSLLMHHMPVIQSKLS